MPKGFRTVVRLNLEGTWLMAYAVATRAFIPSGAGGKVISVALTLHAGLPGMADSSAARAGGTTPPPPGQMPHLARRDR